VHIPVHVLIRPRSGHFVFSCTELKVMIEDIKMVGQLGVQGAAIGVLTEDNKINVEQVPKRTSLLLLALKSEFCQVFYWQTHGKLCGGMEISVVVPMDILLLHFW
jgi:copper homeostasis protein